MNWCEQISKCCLYIDARLKTIDSSWWTLGINWFDRFPDTVLSLSSSRKLASLHGGMKFVENSVVLGAKSNTWSKKHKWKFKIIFSLYLSFFVIFLFVCLLLLFFTFVFSFSSDIRFKRTLSLVYSRHEGGNLSSGTNYMSPFHGCVMFTCATILLTYRSTMKHSPIATKVIKCLWGYPICSLIHRCWGCILKV